VSGVGTTKLTARAINGGEPSGQRPRRFLAGPARLAGKSDEALVKLAKQGDEYAIAALYERYNAAILRYCNSILRSQQEAEDVQQEVFVHAISALRRGPGPISFRPWLYRVAHNACISHLRSRKPTVVAEDNTMAAASREPETVQREELRQLLDDIGRLSEVQRGALLLREMDGMSYEQIAHALDLPLTTVRSTIFRARSTLQGLAEARDADCETIQAELSEMADRRGRRSRRITSHLHVCDQCRRFREGLRYRPGVLREVESPRRLEGLRNNSKVAAIIAATLALLGGGAVAMMQTFDESGQRTPATATKPGKPAVPAPDKQVQPAPRRHTPHGSGTAHPRPLHIPPFRVPAPSPAPSPGIAPPPRADGSHPRADDLRFTPSGGTRQHRKPVVGGRTAPPVSSTPGAGTAPGASTPVAPPAGPAPDAGTPPSPEQQAPQSPATEDPATPESPPVTPIHTHNPDVPPTDPGTGVDGPAPDTTPPSTPPSTEPPPEATPEPVP
jgi:RNA polymerase sigma factor (sigma-70 family)